MSPADSCDVGATRFYNRDGTESSPRRHGGRSASDPSGLGRLAVGVPLVRHRPGVELGSGPGGRRGGGSLQAHRDPGAAGDGSAEGDNIFPATLTAAVGAAMRLRGTVRPLQPQYTFAIVGICGRTNPNRSSFALSWMVSAKQRLRKLPSGGSRTCGGWTQWCPRRSAGRRTRRQHKSTLDSVVKHRQYEELFCIHPRLDGSPG